MFVVRVRPEVPYPYLTHMRQIESSNPAFRNGAFTRAGAIADEGVMTLGGTILKSMVLVLVTAGFTLYTWQKVPLADVGPYVIGGAIGGFLIALLTIFRPALAPWTAPIYAVLEGIALGGISALYSSRYAGLPAQAVVLTFGVFVVMLGLYGSGLVRATPLFRRVLVTAAMALMGFYLLTFIVSFFGIQMPLVNSATPMGIGFSVVACLIASFFLILDFDLISEGVKRQAPKRMEWYGAFTLLVSLVWIYLEMLRLLGKLRR